ncbi:hypothetical protein GCM10029992_36500 [Glycomyces albus]
MEHLLCDKLAIFRDWATAFARFDFTLDLVEDIDEHYMPDEHAGHLTYWQYDLHEGRPRDILLELGDWGLTLSGDPERRHLDLLNLQTFLLQRSLPWATPTDPLHELLRAARLLSVCAATYSRIDRAAVYHSWTRRLRDLAPALFSHPDDVQAIEAIFDAACDRLGDRYIALAPSGFPTDTILAGAGLDFPDFADAATWSPDTIENAQEPQPPGLTGSNNDEGTVDEEDRQPRQTQPGCGDLDIAVPEADRAVIEAVGTNPAALFARVNALIDTAVLPDRARPFPADLQRLLDRCEPDRRAEVLAGRIASAAWCCGGVTLPGGTGAPSGTTAPPTSPARCPDTAT